MHHKTLESIKKLEKHRKKKDRKRVERDDSPASKQTLTTHTEAGAALTSSTASTSYAESTGPTESTEPRGLRGVECVQGAEQVLSGAIEGMQSGWAEGSMVEGTMPPEEEPEGEGVLVIDESRVGTGAHKRESLSSTPSIATQSATTSMT